MKKKRARTKAKSSGSRSPKAVKKISRLVKTLRRPLKKGSTLKTSLKKKLPGPSSAKKNSRPEFLPADLPFSYGSTRLVLLVRDPQWAYAYWDFSGETWEWIQQFFKKDPRVSVKLRVHNLSSGSFFDLDIQLEAKNWYVCVGQANCEFEAELGLVDSKGRFHCIAKSNRVRTPRSGPSEKIDPNWDPKNFEEIYRLSGGRYDGKGSEFLSSFTQKHLSS